MLGFGPLGTFPLAGLPPGGISVIGRLDSTIRLGAVINITFVAVGGTAPYTWAATGLPTGLSINASTGVLSGTTTAVGSFTATVTATDSLSATGSTGPMAVTVIALPAFNYDFPNPQPKRWPSDVRTGWIWQTPTALQIPAGAYMASSKFIAYAVIVPQPYNVRRVYENPLPIPPNKWSFLRRWESGPPFPLRETPYHPFGAQVFPDWFPPIKREGFVAPSLVELLLTNRAIGMQVFPDRLPRLPRQYMDHSYPIGLRQGGEDMVVSFLWG